MLLLYYVAFDDILGQFRRAKICQAFVQALNLQGYCTNIGDNCPELGYQRT